MTAAAVQTTVRQQQYLPDIHKLISTNRHFSCVRTSAHDHMADTAATGAGRKHQILVSNDDGIKAPGLRALVEALTSQSENIEVYVCAPSGERSAQSHAITLGRCAGVVLSELEGIAGSSTSIQARAVCINYIASRCSMPEPCVSLGSMHSYQVY